MYYEVITFIQVISLCYVYEFAFLLSQSQSLNSILDWNNNLSQSLKLIQSLINVQCQPLTIVFVYAVYSKCAEISCFRVDLKNNSCVSPHHYAVNLGGGQHQLY